MSDAPKDSGSAKDGGTYELITPPNTLKARLGAGTGIDAELAKRADTAVKNVQGNFLKHISDAIGDIADQVELAEKPGNDGYVSAEKITRISQDLQLRGVALGYPLVGDICTSLCNYIENLEVPGDMVGKVVGTHTDAIRSVVANDIEGDGGQVGQDMVESLKELVTRTQR
jgi:hypothetical protein